MPKTPEPSILPSFSDLLPTMPNLPGLNLISTSTEKTISNAATASLNFGSQATQWGLTIASALGIFIAGWLVAKWVMNRSHRALVKAKVGDTAAQFIASSLRFVIILTAFIFALLQLGVPGTSMAAILGGITIALGLGLKDTLTNVAAGIMLLVNRPFETGDFIQMDAHKGTVKRINLFQTEINTLDNIRIFVPNLVIWNSAIQNHTHNRVRMVEVFVGLGYQHTAAQCRKALEAALAREPLILREPAPFVGLDTLGDNAQNYLVRVWVRTTDYGKVRYTLLERIKAATEAHNLTIPFPQRTVHMALPESNPAATKHSPKARKKRS
ncbi:MAG: mechanosensitive ion channel family protein [Alphaproteobacteria bacterium]